jgi:hypothetical protein
MKLTFKPLYQWYWQPEGVFWVRKNWTIRTPRKGQKKDVYQLRKINSKPGKLEEGEADFGTLKDAMKRGNLNIRNRVGK